MTVVNVRVQETLIHKGLWAEAALQKRERKRKHLADGGIETRGEKEKDHVYIRRKKKETRKKKKTIFVFIFTILYYN